MSLIDLFKGFHRDAIQQEFPPSTRVLFDTLLYKFNEAFWTDKLVLSERELIQLTGLPKTTVNDAKRFLAARHIIKITPFKNKTSYSLGDEWAKLAPTGSRPVTDQSPTISRPVSDRFGGLSITHVREDVKTVDVKTLTADTATRVREPHGTETAPGYMDADDFDAFIDDWADSPVFCRLDFELISELKVLADNYGVKALRETMATAKKANGRSQGVSFDFFKAVLERRQNSQLRLVKGGERRASNPQCNSQKQSYAYTPAPEYAIDFERD